MKNIGSNIGFQLFLIVCIYSCSNSISPESQNNLDSDKASSSAHYEVDTARLNEINPVSLDTNLCDISPEDFLKLSDVKIQNDFFRCLDSVLAKQYVDEVYNDTLTVDISPKYLNQFLADIEVDSLRSNNKFEYYYHFNIAPSEYSDPPECKDGIHLLFDEDNCMFRLSVSNTFLVEPNWCVESSVSYYFTLKNGKILYLSRQLAG